MCLSVHLGVDLFLGLVVTVPAMFVVGVLIQWVFISRLGERERTAMSILATYSVAIIIEGVLGLVFGEDYVQLNAWYVNQSFHVFGFYLPYIYVFGFLLAVGLLGALYLMLYRTRFGSSVRATMQDRSAAQTGRYRRGRVAAVTFGIGVVGYRRRRDGFRRYELVQPQHRVRPHFPPARHRDPWRPREYRRCAWRRGRGARRRGRRGRRLVAQSGRPFVFFAMLIIVLSVKPSGLFGQAAARAQ